MKTSKRNKMIIVASLGLVILLLVIISLAVSKNLWSSDKKQSSGESAVSEPEEKHGGKVMIENVEPIMQDDLKAGCETYACTMLLRKLGFDVDQYFIADNYLNCQYVITGDDGVKYGPDMHSAFAGTAYAGWGVYAPAMAKSMNRYLDDQSSELNAYPLEDVPIETLCEDYISKGVPVMVWATTDMDEPYVFDEWIVDYVDENAKAQKGDTVPWYMHEHCLVLIGYDDSEYYFADSTHGNISHFEKELAEERYEQMGKQAIVVK